MKSALARFMIFFGSAAMTALLDLGFVTILILFTWVVVEADAFLHDDEWSKR